MNKTIYILLYVLLPLITNATNYNYVYSGNNNITITNATFGTLHAGDNVFINYLSGGWRSITIQGLKTGANVTYNDTTTYINIRFINGAYITPSASQLDANFLDSCQGVRIAYMSMKNHADIGFRAHGYSSDIWIDHYDGTAASGFGPLPTGSFSNFAGDTTLAWRNWRWSYCKFDTSYGTNSGQIAISCASGLNTNNVWLGARIDHSHFNYYSSASGGANFISGDNCYGCIAEYDTLLNLGVASNPNGHTAAIKWDQGWWICRYNLLGPGIFGNDFRTKNSDIAGTSLPNYHGLTEVYMNISHNKRKYPFVESQEPNSSFITSMGVTERRTSAIVINNTCYSMANGTGLTPPSAYLTAVHDCYVTDSCVTKNNILSVVNDTTWLPGNLVFMISASTGSISHYDTASNKLVQLYANSGLADTNQYYPIKNGLLFGSGVTPPSYITQDIYGTPVPQNGRTDIGAVQLVTASKYYFSISGSDANACSLASPCQTITKLNSLSLNPGDSVFFKSGDTLYGSVRANVSSIYYGAYSIGARPVITGFTTLTPTLFSGNIYSASSPGFNYNTGILVMNGIQQTKARFPNSGYRTFTTHNVDSSITDPTLSGTPNWTGGQVVIRNNQYTLSTNLITNHSGNTINYNPSVAINPNSGWGYFIINDSLALDSLGENWWSSVTNNMYIYLGATPPSPLVVKASTQDTLFNIASGLRNITVRGIEFDGSSMYGACMGKDTSILFDSCIFKYGGGTAWWVQQGDSCKLTNSVINGFNSFGVGTDGSGKAGYRGHDSVLNCGNIPGQGVLIPAHAYIGMFTNDTTAINEYNYVHNTGYSGIVVYDDSSVNNNVVDSFCSIIDDGGGIYHTGYTDSNKVHLITNNIVTNGIGAAAGTNVSTTYANGIYVDQNNVNVSVVGNSVRDVSNAGIFLHNSRKWSASGNSVYNAGYGFLIQGDNAAQPIYIASVKYNIFGTVGQSQLAVKFASYNGYQYIHNVSCDSNYYASASSTPFYSGLNQNYSQWGDSTGDRHSVILGQADELRLNKTNSTIVSKLSQNFTDQKGTYLYTNFSLLPFSSRLLFKKSFIMPPPPVGVRFSVH